MGLTTKEKNEPVKVMVLRRFRYFKPDGSKVIFKPGDKVELPFQFAREMEAAIKVSFDLKAEIEVETKK